MNKEQIDVFISRKSQDAKYAKRIYDYLKEQGLNPFESDTTLGEIGNAEYQRAIDDVIVRATHLMVVSSSKEYINSGWVEAEWRFFLNRKRSGKAEGNLFTVICNNMKLDDVPASLQNYEVIPFNKKNFSTIFNYCRRPEQEPKPQPPKPYPFGGLKWYRRLTVVLFLMVLVSTVASAYFITRPFDATVFLKPADISLSSDYPPFMEGRLSLFINGNESQKEVLLNGEVNFRQLAYEVKNEWVRSEYHGKYWKLAKDSILVEPEMTVEVIPDGSLSKVYGQLFTNDASTLANVKIQIDQDTIIYTDSNGLFSAVLPVAMQKPYYELLMKKDNYQTKKERYYPGSGRMEEVLENNLD